MGFLKKLASLFTGGGGGGEEAYSRRIYVRCNACGEPIAVRIDTRNDLSPEWESSSATGSDQPDYYTCRKEVLGRGRCYRKIEVELRFNRQRQLESQRALGGTLLEEEEYQQAISEWEGKKGDAQQ
ncbi:MAG: hypothetical protein ACUVWR_14505 [Anaerolineae bacterium]